MHTIFLHMCVCLYIYISPNSSFMQHVSHSHMKCSSPFLRATALSFHRDKVPRHKTENLDTSSGPLDLVDRSSHTIDHSLCPYWLENRVAWVGLWMPFFEKLSLPMPKQKWSLDYSFIQQIFGKPSPWTKPNARNLAIPCVSFLVLFD